MFKSYTKRDKVEETDFEIILNDSAIQVDVYRHGTSGTDVGFNSEVAARTKTGTIKARIEKAKSQHYSALKSEAGLTIELLFVGFTSDNIIGIKKNDEWHVNNEVYLVMEFDGTRNIKEALLKKMI